MSTYATVYELDLDTDQGAGTVRVNRDADNGTVRLDVEARHGAAYLDTEQAEAVAIALLDAADLIAGDVAPLATSRTRTHVTGHDAAMRKARTALGVAVDAGVTTDTLLEVLIAAVRGRSLLGTEDRTAARLAAKIIGE